MLTPVDTQVFEEIRLARQDPRLEERDDILALLVQARRDDGNPLLDREIRDQLVTLLIQGHTSTANGIAWSLERLMRHPQVNDRLRAEVEAGNDDYLEAVIKETLRLRPPLPFVMRRVNKPFPLGEYELEPGIMTACNLYILHRRERSGPSRIDSAPSASSRRNPSRTRGSRSGAARGVAASAPPSRCKSSRSSCAPSPQARLMPAEFRDEEINRLGVGFTPSRGAEAVLIERVPAVGAAQAA